MFDTNVRPHTPPRIRLGAFAWSGCVLGLACVLPLTTGCQTAAPWADAQKKSAAQANPTSLTQTRNDSNSAKTQFHPKPTLDQQFNVHMELGKVYETQQQFDAALAEYQKALEACSRHGLGGGVKGSGTRQALAHRRMGGAFDRLGRFTQAETHYRTALKLSPDDASVWNDAGYSYHLQSRWVDAERSLKTAAKLAPDDRKIQTNLGLTLAAAGKTDEALGFLCRAAGDAAGHANLGYILASMGRPDEAREHFRKAIEIQPKLAVARQALLTLQPKPAGARQIAAIPTPPLPPGTDANVRRTSGPRATPLSVSAPLPPR